MHESINAAFLWLWLAAPSMILPSADECRREHRTWEALARQTGDLLASDPHKPGVKAWFRWYTAREERWAYAVLLTNPDRWSTQRNDFRCLIRFLQERK